MDSKKIIKKYIMPSSTTRYIGIICAIALVACLVMGAIAANAKTEDPVDFYPSETPTHTMAYIDVVGVSNWLYKVDDVVYYSVEDAYGYLYTVRLSNRQYKEMEAQQEYWSRTSENAPMPEPYHLVGYVQAAGSEMKESLASSWDITVAEYEEYFGVNYLNATTSVNGEKSAGWFVGSVLFGVLALIFLILQGKASSVSKKCLARLEARGLLDRAAQQLENTAGHSVVSKNRAILTQDFLFGKGTGAVLYYGDILWAYKKENRRNFVVVSCNLMAGTTFMNAESVIDINGADKEGHIPGTLMYIAQRNPSAMLGFTNENRSAFNAARKAAK